MARAIDPLSVVRYSDNTYVQMKDALDGPDTDIGRHQAVANAFENKKALPKEGSLVVLRGISGARFVSRYHRTRIRETTRHPN